MHNKLKLISYAKKRKWTLEMTSANSAMIRGPHVNKCITEVSDSLLYSRISGYCLIIVINRWIVDRCFHRLICWQWFSDFWLYCLRGKDDTNCTLKSQQHRILWKHWKDSEDKPRVQAWWRNYVYVEFPINHDFFWIWHQPNLSIVHLCFGFFFGTFEVLTRFDGWTWTKAFIHTSFFLPCDVLNYCECEKDNSLSRLSP